ncbi:MULTISPECIES: flavin-containing monooxygenase [Phyllobacteriaceae]|jgi:cation diffusion facilitator CzcD-associated flavoprotein CzcO|uniref:Dimethylaniline monooxygenase n=1 Tax=Mesorhizobium hungaricum TaxID=1566387 RepID=A0A1C2DJV0_9HYPH|nr:MULTISPECIES: NAD(P)/FAD-dependent oxidoreductase [Mesorhizobium]MBN9233420.1 NAD(P)/FAD-dependent oxidoreductase [Mesorhizobium sp.]MDQ0331890.1 cation diffusion facilitator CzcD-associated flavoprotein CzcO [Mesorhizobium sp. YL-MeA3-2017]OCX14997.1 dimethylaniline monooxygenase [Mesorhizobium hungaricum]
MTETIEPVIVIGAGAAGLAAADALARHGIKASVFEREQRIAEPWHQRHERLALNTHRDMSFLPGMPYPRGVPAFPPKAAVIAYLEQFARQRGIAVEFGMAVERVTRDGDHFAVHTAKGVRHARNVIIATGHDQVPWMPDWPGAATFGGRLIHAAKFGSPKDYEGKRVLVVGAGNSGFDALNYLVGAKAASITVAGRAGPSVLPKRIGKIAVQRFSRITNALPVPIGNFMVALLQRAMFGDLRKLGFAPVKKGAISRLRDDHVAIAADDGAIAAIKAGRIKVVTSVARFEPEQIVLADGSAIEADIVIAATGYRTGLEPMLDGLGVLNSNGAPKTNGAEPGNQPGLWFISMRPSVLGHFYTAGQEAKAIAAKIAGKG